MSHTFELINEHVCRFHFSSNFLEIFFLYTYFLPLFYIFYLISLSLRKAPSKSETCTCFILYASKHKSARLEKVPDLLFAVGSVPFAESICLY